MKTRVDNMKDNLQQLNDSGVRKTQFYSLAYESLLQTEGQPTELRRAKAQAHLLRSSPVGIHPYEPIVGTLTSLCPVDEDVPSPKAQREKAAEVLDRYIEQKKGGKSCVKPDRNAIKFFDDEFSTKKSRWALMSRDHRDADIEYSEMQDIIEEMTLRYKDESALEPYEIGRELERSFKFDFGEARRAVDSLPWFAGNHLSYDYASIMNTGFDVLLKKIAILRSSAAEEKKAYYESAYIAASALADFFTRYGKAAEKAACQERDPERAAELCSISRTLADLAHRPAHSFAEGLQFVWLLHTAANVLHGTALSFGRFDQYMYPLYARDIKTGAITESRAEELMCCFWLKANEPMIPTVQSMTIGGITPDGKSAANTLTSLLLKVIARMKLPYPNVGARINSANPKWYLDEVTECVGTGAGQPMIMSDKTWISNLRRLGYSEETANNYYNMGCVEIMIPGCQPSWGVTDPIAFPMLLENVFADIRSGAIFPKTYEQFREAYLNKLLAAVEDDYNEAKAKQADIHGKCFDPFGSLMTDGCLERGKDMFQGGAKLGTHWSFYAYGLGTAADSMIAVKKAVYDEHRLTIREMAGVLSKNFCGAEPLRLVLSGEPHYGNDDDSVDLEARIILKVFDDAVFSYNRAEYPDKYVTTMFGYFFHIYHGEITGATPNGRRSGEAFSDSMGPSQGADVNGPTKMLNSVLKLDHTRVTGGYALNLKLNPEHMRGAKGRIILGGLIKGYLESGGPQIQIVMVDTETLKSAQKSPEKYRSVVVRVGGYCEYFVNLDRSLQNEIIKRTLHC